MLYTTFNVGDTEYKLRLNAKNAVALERKLGKHPLMVLMELQNDSLPKVEDFITVLHASLQCYNANISVDKVYDLYDNMVENGFGMAESLLLLTEIYKTAGFIPDDVNLNETSENAKNA